MRGIADVAARGRVGGQHAALGGGVFHSMSMPMVRAGSSRSTTATVVTSKPSGATRVMAVAEGEVPVSMRAPRSLSNW